ncbi:MAG: chemotaxis protein [Opitutales bacterium]
MIIKCIISILVIFGVLSCWVLVQHLGRAFALRHPEFGPPKEEGAGCGMCGKTCKFSKQGCAIQNDHHPKTK